MAQLKSHLLQEAFSYLLIAHGHLQSRLGSRPCAVLGRHLLLQLPTEDLHY